MRKTALTLMLLFSAACLLAQDNMSKPSDTSTMTTMQGCVSTLSNQFFLTDSSGNKVKLSGYANKLRNEVGKEVEVTGMSGVRTVGTTQQGAGSTAKQQPVFKVKTVTHIADTCKPM